MFVSRRPWTRLPVPVHPSGLRLKTWQATRRHSPPPPPPRHQQQQQQQQHFTVSEYNLNPPVPRASDYTMTLARQPIAEQRLQPLYFNRDRAMVLARANSRPTTNQLARTEIASYGDCEITRLRADLGHRGLIQKGSKAEVCSPPSL